MSDQRSPDTDQQLPVPGTAPVHSLLLQELASWPLPEEVRWAVERGIGYRRDLGIRKYSRPLEANNGRDALQDAWEEVLDAISYVYQLRLETGTDQAYVFGHLVRALEGLTLMKVSRGDLEAR